jgi:prolyl oligopeptidase
VKTALADAPAYATAGGLPGAEAMREFAISKDGTRVPVDVVRMKGTPQDGTQPVLPTGYGG